MKKLIIIVLAVVFWAGVCLAGEREELALKWRALVAEYQLAQMKFQDAQKQVQEFTKELDGKGLMVDNTGQVVSKPKPVPKLEVPKEVPKK